jgi:hypothetical protein
MIRAMDNKLIGNTAMKGEVLKYSSPRSGKNRDYHHHHINIVLEVSRSNYLRQKIKEIQIDKKTSNYHC